MKIDQAKSVREGDELSIDKLNQYLKDQIPGWEDIKEIRQFPGGYSNLTYHLITDQREYVLRKPPRGAKIKSAHDMGREYRVLSLLKPHYKKIPDPIHYCENEDIIGAPFFIMERVKGFIIRSHISKDSGISPEMMHEICRASIENLVKLHSLDIQETGLADIGKAEGYVERQIEGWVRRYEKAETEKIEDMDILGKWLKENIPHSLSPTLIHNDYKYDNLILDPEQPDNILAVLDWEMATVGDPMMDLATTLAYWAEENDSPVLKGFSPTSYPGNMNREEVLDYYGRLSGRRTDSFVFYYIYGVYKVAVIAQQIYKRFLAGMSKDQRFAMLIYVTKGMAGNGMKALEQGRIGSFQ